jgi:CTP synthase
MGHYERFTNAVMAQKNNHLRAHLLPVITKERRGSTGRVKYPISPMKQGRRPAADGSADVAIIEIGGTACDIEGRRLSSDPAAHRSWPNTPAHPFHPGPRDKTAGEVRPMTQHSVRELRRRHPARHPDLPDPLEDS